MAVVVITGCSSGFGLEAALAFARAGDTVYASMRNPARGGSLRDRARAESLDIHCVELDITKGASFAPLVRQIVAESGRLDVLVNNAGILHPGAFEDLTERQIREVMETNFVGPMLLTRAVLPQMRLQRSGYVIMVSSLSGIAGLPADVCYSASKFALEGATEALRHEVDRFGIRVALIEAGLYATSIFGGNIDRGTNLPVGYPTSSPYSKLVAYRNDAWLKRLPEAQDPAGVAELMVRVSRSDGTRLRWPADPTAERVLAKMLGMDDRDRDTFLRSVADTHWWSVGQDEPPHPANE
ncbi:MAG: SDR family oxidoreductase [Steroidobacteraceae bacterium]